MVEKKMIGHKQDYSYLHYFILFSSMIAMYCFYTAITNPLSEYYISCLLVGSVQLCFSFGTMLFRFYLWTEKTILKTEDLTVKTKNGETWMEWDIGKTPNIAKFQSINNNKKSIQLFNELKDESIDILDNGDAQ